VWHYGPGTYPTLLTISTSNVVFDTGVYTFCAGLSFSGGASATNLTGPTTIAASSITTLGVADTSAFNATGGSFIVDHGGAASYFTYTGRTASSGAGNLTGVAFVFGGGTTQFTTSDQVYPAATSGPGGVLFYVRGGTITK